MRTKILHFKFKKKYNEQQNENCSETKNYETIFNNILNGENLDNIKKLKYKDNSTISKNKNKIKHISKLDTLKAFKDKKANTINNENDISIKEITNKKKENNNNVNNNAFIGEKNSLFKEKEENKNQKSHAEELLSKKLNVSLIKQFKNEKNEINHIKQLNTSSNNNRSNKNKISKKLKINKKNIQSSKRAPQETLYISNNNKNKDFERKNLSGCKQFKSKIKNKSEISFRPKSKGLSTKKNSLIKNKFLITNKKKIINHENITKDIKKTNKLSPYQKEILVYKNEKKINCLGYDKKITITDNNTKNKKRTKTKNNKLKAGKFNSKEKKLILNNTNSNININININNINDDNITKKESDFVINGLSNNKISNKNNFNNNITTVNIINNNNDINNNKKKLNDYHLLWFNRSNRDNLPYLQKISSKGIKIQSININLGEDLEDNNCNKNNNINFEPNPLKDYNASEINKEKETKSEYNHYRDIDDLWSSKSLSSYSCKSGYTITRKLRSLSRERDKIKLLNQCKKNKNDIKMIGDKLLNIVNNFHNNNVINLKKSRRKDEIRKINKKNKRNKIIDIDNKNTYLFRKKIKI